MARDEELDHMPTLAQFASESDGADRPCAISSRSVLTATTTSSNVRECLCLLAAAFFVVLSCLAIGSAESFAREGNLTAPGPRALAIAASDGGICN
jgi:hypothetical protein